MKIITALQINLKDDMMMMDDECGVVKVHLLLLVYYVLSRK